MENQWSSLFLSQQQEELRKYWNQIVLFISMQMGFSLWKIKNYGHHCNWKHKRSMFFLEFVLLEYLSLTFYTFFLFCFCFIFLILFFIFNVIYTYKFDLLHKFLCLPNLHFCFSLVIFELNKKKIQLSWIFNFFFYY